MKKLRILMAMFALALLVGRVLADEMNEKHAKIAEKSDSKAMKCEVIDVACYIAKGAKGSEHQGCAAKCIGEGGELALLNDGNLYIPVDKNFHSARRLFVTKGGEMVSVNGKKVEKSGLKYMVIDGAEKKK
jgi:hypothetical protein